MAYQHTMILTLFLAAACWPEPLPPEPHTGCSSACERLRALKCEEGDPTPQGAPCEEVCANVERVEYAQNWPTECITRAQSCAQARSCE